MKSLVSLLEETVSDIYKHIYNKSEGRVIDLIGTSLGV